MNCFWWLFDEILVWVGIWLVPPYEPPCLFPLSVQNAEEHFRHKYTKTCFYVFSFFLCVLKSLIPKYMLYPWEPWGSSLFISASIKA